MKRKKILSLLLLSTMLMTSIVPTYADTQDIVNQETSKATVGVDSEFTKKAKKPGDLSGLVISLPDKLVLTENEETHKYTCDDYVSAKGDLNENYVLSITVPLLVKYTSEVSALDTVTAETTFQREQDIPTLQFYTSDELEKSKTELDSRPLNISLDADTVETIGNYNGIVDFKISTTEYQKLSEVNKLFDATKITQEPVDENSFGKLNLQVNWLGSDILMNDSAIGQYLSQNTNGTMEIPAYVLDGSNKYLVTDLKKTFMGINYLKSAIVPSTVKNLEGTFSDCSALSKVELPDSVEYMKETFNYCTRLKTVKIPESCNFLSYAFKYCTSLEKIEIPDNSVYNMKDGKYHATAGTFYNCTNLKSVKLGANMTELAASMFNNCTSLESIEIPSKVSRLTNEGYMFSNEDVGPFYKCTALKSIKIPYSLKYIVYDSFKFDTALKDIYYAGDKSDIFLISGINLKTKTTDTNSTNYILANATWHCADGDYVPASDWAE